VGLVARAQRLPDALGELPVAPRESRSHPLQLKRQPKRRTQRWRRREIKSTKSPRMIKANRKVKGLLKLMSKLLKKVATTI
jgi:hypothetical protein